MKISTYTQPEKQRARQLVLERAVSALTDERDSSAVVRVDEFDETLNYVLHFLKTRGFNSNLARELAAHAREWQNFHKSSLGTRSAADLRVMYLCGPEPRNDLEILLKLGITPQNIWAIESERDVYRKAVEQLLEGDVYIRVHHGSLETFFDTTNERFDIVYIDACGPLPGGHPNTLRAPLLMHHHERLTPLGALITNFSQPGEEKRQEYMRLFTYYFAVRYNDLPAALWNTPVDPAIAEHDPSHLLAYTDQYFDELYSDFITRLLIDIGREILPRARVYANPDLRRKYFAPEDTLSGALKKALQEPPAVEPSDTVESYMQRFYATIGHVHLSPGGYPVLSFLRRAAADKALQPLVRALLDHRVRSDTIEKSFQRSTLLATVLEGHWDAASAEMMAALRRSWVDKAGGLFCDVPLPHLLINSMFGIYGRPVLPNPRPSLRFSYTAKTRKMYTDMLILDQCRYYFDFLPTIDLIPRRFESWAFQLVLRVCLDRMGRHDFSSSSHPFRGAALAAFGEFPSATAYNFPERVRNLGTAMAKGVAPEGEGPED